MVKNLKMALKVLKDYYIKQKPKLMKNFSKHIKVATDMLKNLYHEVYNEIEKDRRIVLKDLKDWLNSHI